MGMARGWGMSLLVLITVAALLQFIVFSSLVSRARGRYGVAAPATSGHEMFERYFRVQMNTLELLVIFVPAFWLAAFYTPPLWIALLGVIYLIGRMVYLTGYVADPRRRGLGFGLSILPILVLLLLAVIGSIRQWILIH